MIAHPPCRHWSAFTAQQALQDGKEAEMALAIWAVDQLREWGGVLEHPAHSRLWDRLGLPMPGSRSGDLAAVEVWQAWWGYPLRKRTWLLFSKVDPAGLEYPFRLDGGNNRRKQQLMSRNQRKATCEPFARWLVDAVKQTAAA